MTEGLTVSQLSSARRLLLPLLAAVAMLPAATARVPQVGAPGSSRSETCVGCHELLPEFSHPVGVVPSMVVPAHLPLDQGRIACTTCHEGDHLRAPSEALGEPSALLRISPEERTPFCVQCHAGGGLDRPVAHAVGTGRAHLLWADDGPDDGTPPVGAAGAGPGGHGGSESCPQCHDGAIARDIWPASVGDPTMGQGHPVDVPYADRAGRAATALYPAPLDLRVRLVEGRVTCESCHSPYSRRRGLLVMSNLGSALCLSCHRI